MGIVLYGVPELTYASLIAQNCMWKMLKNIKMTFRAIIADSYKTCTSTCLEPRKENLGFSDLDLIFTCQVTLGP